MNRDLGWLFILMLVLSAVFVAAMFILEHRRFDECMAERHDRKLCEVWARGGIYPW